MLSISKRGSASDAKAYFAHKDVDYFTQGNSDTLSSSWFGQSAVHLGLSGRVNNEDFAGLVDGQFENQTLGKMIGGKIKHTGGWDFTFSAPKSVSILGIAVGDDRLIEAHKQAVNVAMHFLESKASVRKTIDTNVVNVKTDNLIAAQFTHSTSRELEPQLHTHNFVLNGSYDVDSEKWMSLDSRPLYRASMMAGMVYRAELAKLLPALGYQVEVTDREKGFFEITGVPHGLIKAFSTRRDQILAAVEKYGYTTAKGFDEAAVRSRLPKQALTQAVVDDWSVLLEEQDVSVNDLMATSKLRVEQGEIQTTLDETQLAVDFAVAHLSEREHVFSEDEVIKQALKQGLGHTDYMSIKDYLSTLKASGELIDRAIETNSGIERGFTTPSAVEKETHIINIMENNKEKTVPIWTMNDIKKWEPVNALNDDQRQVVIKTLSSTDRFNAVQGYAGVGKTSAIKPMVDAIVKKGYEVKAIAPTGAASTVLGEALGIKPQTLAKHIIMHSEEERKKVNSDSNILSGKGYSPVKEKKLYLDVWIGEKLGLLNEENTKREQNKYKKLTKLDVLIGKKLGLIAIIDQDKEKKDRVNRSFDKDKPHYWVVDEASFSNTNDVLTLMQQAEKWQASVLFLGDRKQLGAIDAGKPFTMLLKAGIKVAFLEKIVRQKGAREKQAVYEAIKNKPNNVFELLKNKLTENENNEDLIKSLVDDLKLLTFKEREEAIILIPNHSTRDVVNKLLREHDQEKGYIEYREMKVNRFRSDNYTNAQQRDIKFYDAKKAIVFNQRVEKFDIEQGDVFDVGEVDSAKNTIILKNKERSIMINVKSDVSQHFNVGEIQKMPLSVGEKIVWKASDKKNHLYNGIEGSVKSIHPNGDATIGFKGVNSTIEYKTNLNKDVRWDYASTRTAYSAQGKTASDVYVLLQSFQKKLITAKSFYVAVSRSKNATNIYVDNKDAVAKNIIENEGDKSSSIESLIREKQEDVLTRSLLAFEKQFQQQSEKDVGLVITK